MAEFEFDPEKYSSELLNSSEVSEKTRGELNEAQKKNSILSDKETEKTLKDATEKAKKAEDKVIKDLLEGFNPDKSKSKQEELVKDFSAMLDRLDKNAAEVLTDPDIYQKEYEEVSKNIVGMENYVVGIFDNYYEANPPSSDHIQKIEESKREVRTSVEKVKKAVENAKDNPKDLNLKEAINDRMSELANVTEKAGKAVADGMGDLFERLTAKMGKKAAWSSLLIWIIKGGIVVGGGILGVFMLLKAIAKATSGCYMYTGNDGGVKISCPGAGKYCSCANSGDASKFTNTSGMCAAGLLPDYQNYPWCCEGSSPGVPPCKGTPGEEGAVYYASHSVTPIGILAGMPGNIVDAAKIPSQDITNLMTTALKWVGYAAIIIIGLLLLFYGSKYVISSMEKKGEGGKSKFSSRRRQ